MTYKHYPGDQDDDFNPDRDTGMEDDGKSSEGNSRIRRLVSRVKKDDEDRAQWREKQAAWYRMRNTGIGRTTLPFKGASDFHFPLIDTFIEKLKPFYYQQALQPEPLCSFVPKTSDARAMSGIASQWFDYKVRTESNFRLALPVLIDLMQERGKGILKITWDMDKKCLAYEAIDPVNLIVPAYTEYLSEADRICHVIWMSKADYMRRAEEHGWLTDPDWLRGASGRSNDEPEIRQDQRWNTGLSEDKDKDLLILWEIYTRDDEGNINIDLVSPLKPDQPVRPTVTKFPYDHNEYPFIEFNYEIKSRSYYDNRGLCEIAGQFEMELCKLENEKLDYMTFMNRPVFTHSGASFNVQNLKVAPGQVIGPNLKAVEMPPPPIDFTQESQNIRGIAENRVGMPDFGQGRNNNVLQARTAKEMELIQQQSNQGIDLRARVFHLALNAAYNQSWKLLIQFCRDNLSYTYRREFNTMDRRGLDDIYIIEPNGNADGYDINTEVQRLIAILQVPVVAQRLDPDKTARMLLELINPRYIHELFVPGSLNVSQFEKQADEIGNMLNGFQIQVVPDDDDRQHLKALIAYFMFVEQAKMQVPVLPTLRMYQHFLQHYEKFAQSDKEAFKQDKQILDQAKGKIEQALPVLNQALQDGVPPMAGLDAVMQHLQQIQQQLNPPPLGPALPPPSGPQGHPQPPGGGPAGPMVPPQQGMPPGGPHMPPMGPPHAPPRPHPQNAPQRPTGPGMAMPR